jgi:molecular chaperone HtpG
LQSDANVKKISGHITRKVADRLSEIFKNDRNQFEEKWDNLKIFIQYGMLTEEKFYEKAEKFALFKNIEGKAFTFEEYKDFIKENQTDKNGDLIYLYTTNKNEQYSYIQHAKDKGYDVLLLDGQLDTHLVNQLEQKWEKSRFVRVDGDVIDKLVVKEEASKVELSDNQRDELSSIFKSQIPSIEKTDFIVTFEHLTPSINPVLITQNEFMRRMKEMSSQQGGMMSFYGEMPDSYNLVINTAHPLISQLLKKQDDNLSEQLSALYTDINKNKQIQTSLQESQKDKKVEEIPSDEKEQLESINLQIKTAEAQKLSLLESFASETKQVKQLIDLALLANNMLKGEALANFVKRSVELM